jgi:hypothetical protein
MRGWDERENGDEVRRGEGWIKERREEPRGRRRGDEGGIEGKGHFLG